MPNLDLILLVGGGVLALVAVLSTVFAWRGESGLLAMHDTPTLSVAELAERQRWVAHGLQPRGIAVEVVGTIECDSPLQAPYSERLCVAYDYLVNEESERRVGGFGRYPGREVELETVDLHGRRVPRFYVRDATGRVAVDTAGATLDLLETVARYEAYTGDRGSEREIWREERALPLGNRVYVLGYLGAEGDTPVIGRHPADPGRRFVISYRDERALAVAVRRRAYSLYLAGGLSFGGAMALVAAALLG